MSMDKGYFPELKSERLLLRAVRDSDINSIFQMYSDPRISEHDTFYPISTLDEARQILVNSRDEYRTGKRIPWGIALQADDRLIGSCSLLNFTEMPKSCEIGCALLPDVWHKGYAVEALKQVIHFAFDVLSVEEVVAFAAPENAASHRMLEKLCFVRQRTVKNRSYYKGRFHDEVEYLNKKNRTGNNS